MNRRRRGASLLEMLAVVTFGAILLGLGGRTLVALIRLDRSGRDRLAEEETLALLARDFRGDVHACHSAEVVGPGAGGLRLEFEPGRSIRYEQEAGALIRVEGLGNLRVSRRSYRLVDRAPPRFEIDGEGRSRIIGIRIRPKMEPPVASTSRVVVIEAAAGLDRRFRAGEGRGDAEGK